MRKGIGTAIVFEKLKEREKHFLVEHGNMKVAEVDGIDYCWNERGQQLRREIIKLPEDQRVDSEYHCRSMACILWSHLWESFHATAIPAATLLYNSNY